MVRISSDTYEYVREIETELFPEPDPFANFDANDAYNSGTYTEPAYQAPSYSPPQQYGQRIDDGLGHYSDDGGATWMNYSGGAYQEPAPAFDYNNDPYFGNFDAGAAENISYTETPSYAQDQAANAQFQAGLDFVGEGEGGGAYEEPGTGNVYYDGHWWNREGDQLYNEATGSWQSPQEYNDYFRAQNEFAQFSQNPTVAQPSVFDSQMGQADWFNYDAARDPNRPEPVPYRTFGEPEPESFFSSWNIRQPDPLEPGYVQDSRFDTSGGMLGSPLDPVFRGIDYVDKPFKETGLQFASLANPYNWLDPTSLSTGGRRGGDYDPFSGVKDFGSSVADSGGNPLEFADIQRAKYDERPLAEQLFGEVFAPSNLIGVGGLKKVGLLDDAAQFAPEAAKTVRGIGALDNGAGAVADFAPDVLRGADATDAARFLEPPAEVPRAIPDIRPVDPEELAFGAPSPSAAETMRAVDAPQGGSLATMPDAELKQALDSTGNAIAKAEDTHARLLDEAPLEAPRAESVITMLERRWEQLSEEAVRRMRAAASGEAGSVSVDFATSLAGRSALGAGVGAAYGEASGGDWKTGAMVGAGIGAGSTFATKAADNLASRGVDAKLAKTAPPPTATSKIIDLIKQAVPVRESQQDLYSKELARRAGIGQSIRSRVPGEAAGRAASGAMKGELPKATFDPIRPQMQPDEITELFEHLRTSNMPFYTWQNTQAALAKVLAGELPTRSEISLLGKAFGDDFAQALLSKRSLKDKAWEAALDAANIPRTLMTAWDASAPLRQGAILTAGHPIEGVKATAAMVRAMASPKYSKLVAEGIENSPNAAVYDKMKLYFADVTQGATLNQREEAIMSRLAGKIPGIAGSQRGYATYLNKIRQGIADNFIQGNPKLSTKEYEQFGHWINIASGRGDLPKLLADNSAIMNAMFAPRYAMSRLQLPGEVVKTMLDPRIGRHARAEMARDITAFAGTGTALLTLGQMAGVWKVELDPRSTDFGKGRIGPTRFDFWAGEQQIARYATQLATGQRKTSTGEIASRGRMDVIQTWLETKMSPTTGLAIDLLRGEDFVGDPVDFKTPGGVGKQAWEMLAPLFLQDMAEAAKVHGSQWAGALAAPAALGASAMSYEDSDWKKRDDFTKENYGGRKFSELSPTEKQQVDQNFGKIPSSSEEGKRAAAVLQDKIREQTASDAKLISGDMTPERWAGQYKDRKQELAITNEEIYHKLDLETKDPILKGYYDAIDKAKGPDGAINWNAVDKYRASLDPKDSDYITKNTGLVKIDTPAVRKYEEARDKIEASGYFERTDENFATIKNILGLPHESYEEWKAAERKRLLGILGDSATQAYAEAEVQAAIEKSEIGKTMTDLGKQWKEAWVIENPDAAYLAWLYGDYTPTKEVKEYLNRRYAGREP
jgi:hypothetical protein